MKTVLSSFTFSNSISAFVISMSDFLRKSSDSSLFTFSSNLIAGLFDILNFCLDSERTFLASSIFHSFK